MAPGGGDPEMKQQIPQKIERRVNNTSSADRESGDLIGLLATDTLVTIKHPTPGVIGKTDMLVIRMGCWRGN